MKYFRLTANFIYHTQNQHLGNISSSILNISKLRQTFPVRFIAKTDFQSKNEVYISSKPTSLFLFNLFYITILVLYGLCTSTQSLAADFHWRKHGSTQKFESYDEACEAIRVKSNRDTTNHFTTPLGFHHSYHFSCTSK